MVSFEELEAAAKAGEPAKIPNSAATAQNSKTRILKFFIALTPSFTESVHWRISRGFQVNAITGRDFIMETVVDEILFKSVRQHYNLDAGINETT
jgi:hypothetical protein